MSDSDDDEDLDLFGEMTEEEKEAKAKKDAVSNCCLLASLAVSPSPLTAHQELLHNCKACKMCIS